MKQCFDNPSPIPEPKSPYIHNLYTIYQTEQRYLIINEGCMGYSKIFINKYHFSVCLIDRGSGKGHVKNRSNSGTDKKKYLAIIFARNYNIEKQVVF